MSTLLSTPIPTTLSEFANGDDQIPVLDKGYLDFQTLYKGVKF